jgi:glucose/arabinose dehydrogenase
MLAIGAAESMAAIAGLQRVASGLNSPTFATHAPGDRTRLFIGERNGAIRILDLTTGQLEATPFLTIPNVDAAGEGGLLGMAFHPDYAANGKFYVNVTIDNGGLVFQNKTSPFSTHIRQYTVSPGNPSVADPTPTPVLDFIQPQTNHNGGWIGFGPNDGYLYVLTGDGGGSNDLDTDGDSDGHTPDTGNAQDTTDNWLGKVLRVDVNGDDFSGDANRNYAIPATNPFVGEPGDDEIWAYGLRNPFRGSFDRATGDLWIGDVGQGAREEIDFQPAASTGGENYGWRLREGFIATPGSVGGPQPPGGVDPVFDYPRSGDVSGKTVIGGYVYRGPDPSLQGTYFFSDSGDFGDSASNKFWTFDPSDPQGTVADIKALLVPNTGSPRYPVSFGEDAVGNLYIVYLETNEVYLVRTNALTPGDFDADAHVDAGDLATWVAGFGTEFGATPADGDADEDDDVDGADFLAWQRSLGYSALNASAPAGAPVPEPAAAAAIAAAACALAGMRRLAPRRAMG